MPWHGWHLKDDVQEAPSVALGRLGCYAALSTTRETEAAASSATRPQPLGGFVVVPCVFGMAWWQEMDRCRSAFLIQRMLWHKNVCWWFWTWLKRISFLASQLFSAHLWFPIRHRSDWTEDQVHHLCGAGVVQWSARVGCVVTMLMSPHPNSSPEGWLNQAEK